MTWARWIRAPLIEAPILLEDGEVDDLSILCAFREPTPGIEMPQL